MSDNASGEQNEPDVVPGMSARAATIARYGKSRSQPAFSQSALRDAANSKREEVEKGENVPGYESSGLVRQPKYKLTYIGNLLLDRRITKHMLKWVLADIRRSKNANKRGSLTISGCNLKVVSVADSSDILLQHNVHSISQFSRCQMDRKCFFYLQRNNVDAPFVMYAFTCDQQDQMIEIFHSIQSASKSTSKPPSFNSSQKTPHILRSFEVRYQGKCFLAEKKKSGQFIDDWLREKSERLERKRNGKAESPRSNRSRHSSSDTVTDSLLEDSRMRRLSEGDERERHDSGSSVKSSSSCLSDDIKDCSDSGIHDMARRSWTSSASATSDLFDECEDGIGQRRGTLITVNDQNKTMLLQIDDNRMSIISLDKKSVILEKTFKEISYCTQGARFSDHFGFICCDSKARNDPNREKPYVMYIFQCASDTVITDVMETLKKAFSVVLKRTQELQNCDFCPMQQFHKLCEDLTYIKDSESAYNCIHTHIVNLPTSAYMEITNKVKVEGCTSYEDANDVLMTKLRCLCEVAQLNHIHGRHQEFSLVNRPTKLGALKNKAKKALAFDMFSKNKLPDEEWKPPTINIKNSSLTDLSAIGSSDSQSNSSSPRLGETDLVINPKRPRSRTLGSLGGPPPPPSAEDNRTLLQKLSNMGHSIEEAIRGEKVTPEKLNHSAKKASLPEAATLGISELNVSDDFSRARCRRSSSWRRDIYDSVVTTSAKKTPLGKTAEETIVVRRSLGKDELQGLWRSAIEQTILLNRMERENRNLQAHQEETKKRRTQLDYDDVNICQSEAANRWKKILKSVENTTPLSELWNAVKDGVPRAKRGEIWQLLAKQYTDRGDEMQGKGEAIPTIDSYCSLLTKLTSHQHAILIDLGRTFPQHEYFKSQLGAGQLCLFNILKAYSLVDPSVGYCQGLSFVAGIFLMHVEEEEAFNLLCHLMYCLGLRQQYLPNMLGLQISMYQLARLIRDRLPEVYDHLEEQEVTPTLYAAPWFLTLFASQFPVGFVARVFDLLLLEGYSALFKVALSLLSVHKELILLCNNFESSTDFLKITLPEMSQIQMEKIFNEVMTMEVSNLHRDLYTYEVEYHVFQEDMMMSGGDDNLSKLEMSNRRLREENTKLIDKLQQQTHKLRNQETVIDALQQSYAKLTTQVREHEQEHRHHVEMIERLRKLVPEHLLSQLDSEPPLKMDELPSLQRTTNDKISTTGDRTSSTDN